MIDVSDKGFAVRG
jgi:hypothetical protein